MNCDVASPASDMWGVGVIAYQMCSGGISPFFAVNRFRTMAKVIEVNYDLDREELSKASDEAKDFITRLLVKDTQKRLTGTYKDLLTQFFEGFFTASKATVVCD